MMLKRRAVLGAAGALFAAPRIGRAQDAQVLKFIPYADAAVLDPIWTTSYATRNHALLVQSRRWLPAMSPRMTGSSGA